ncbi:hypothetical protein PLEOSDRAFT_1090115 [Pleurotus ostreatus PC15]|uniref:Uncharacterized protein n=1 Tax=Pleurotus ostreatus (strain PC15) TaxID=1137138 RepID=A0A067NF87_PLEO1|nr:hypothetical protein PLEOSDRAFT_1090115 [Pleurotus ostreatus PC15]
MGRWWGPRSGFDIWVGSGTTWRRRRNGGLLFGFSPSGGVMGQRWWYHSKSHAATSSKSGEDTLPSGLFIFLIFLLKGLSRSGPFSLLGEV